MVAAQFNVVNDIATIACNYIVIDIETGNPPEQVISDAVAKKIENLATLKTDDEIEEEINKFSDDWTAPSNIIDESKIAARKELAIKKHLEKLINEQGIVREKLMAAGNKIRGNAALMDPAPIICVCCKSNLQSVAFNGMSADQFAITGWSTIGCCDEKSMLILLREWLDKNTDQNTQLVGHNVRFFDKPKLRNRYAFHRLKLPQILIIGQGETFDTMQLAKHFSVERNDMFISLDDLCCMLDIEQPKQIISGKKFLNCTPTAITN